MISTFRKILDLLDARERRRFRLLALLMMVVGAAELLGMSAVLVFLNLVTRPEAVLEVDAVRALHDRLGFTDIARFQVAAGCAVLAGYLAALAIRTAASFANTRFASLLGASLARRLLSSYLHRPYAWFLGSSPADLHKKVLNEVDQLVGSVLVPTLQLTTSTVSIAFIVAFLLTIEPVVSLVAGGLLGGGYALIYLSLRGFLLRIGVERAAANRERFALVAEATGGFKDVKLMGLETVYTDRFGAPALRVARAIAKVRLVSEMPRFALEGLTFLAMVVLILVLVARSGGDPGALLPVLGTFGFAAMRLLPALQQLFFGFASLRTGQAVLDQIHADYVSAPHAAPAAPVGTSDIRLNSAIELRGLRYRYDGAERAALRGVDLTIPAFTSVGLVGGTGAGKTTLVDLLLGLLQPDAGEIVIDGQPLTPGTMRGWQRRIGYVPQAIYLSDDSIAQNIAFGVAPDRIDMAAVERAGRMAALHDFVTSDLPAGYATIVGDRGIRLSGGQRQRIGIARALYGDPDLLVLDEATSALDTLTEQAVMEAVDNVQGRKTIVMIAHRLTTVRNCDRIFLLEQGRVSAAGRYDDLVADNEVFRRMATGA